MRIAGWLFGVCASRDVAAALLMVFVSIVKCVLVCVCVCVCVCYWCVCCSVCVFGGVWWLRCMLVVVVLFGGRWGSC